MQPVYGVKGTAKISYNGTLHELANELKEHLQIYDLIFDTDMDYPHEEFAMGSGLGLDCWITKGDKSNTDIFEFSISTFESGAGEILNSRMYDISPWLVNLLESYGYDVN